MTRAPTPKQAALIDRLKGGRLLMAYTVPGVAMLPKWYIENPYSDEDGRTVAGLFARAMLKSEGGGMYILIERPA